MAFKVNLRAMRENAWLTMEEASRRLGISHVTLRSFELGERIPNLAQLHAFADVYNCPVDAIKVGDKKPKQ